MEDFGFKRYSRLPIKRKRTNFALPAFSIEHLLSIHRSTSADGCDYCHKTKRKHGYKTWIHEQLEQYRSKLAPKD